MILLGWGDLGIMGEPSRETPHLDKMAAKGMLFTNFYTAAAICSPSRASMLTGRLPIRNGFYSDNFRGRNAYTPQEIVGGIPDSEVLISELLQKAGYHTKLIGKWHLGHRSQYHPLRHGFSEWVGAPNCHFYYDGKHHPNIPVYEGWNMTGRYYEDFIIDLTTHESNFTMMLRDQAVEFIKRASRPGKPFFLYWAPDSTHAPSYASKEFLGTSRRGSPYGDAVREIDAAVGDILAAVQDSGIAGDTLVIFTSDNGAALVSKEHAGSNGPLLCGKQTTFEGGFRTPTIAYWPGHIIPGSVSMQVATQMDFFATFLDLAHQPLPKDRFLDSFSLKRTLLENEEDESRSVFFYRGDLLYAIRQGSYKMHLWTWTTPTKELKKGIDHCPDMFIPNVTTTRQVNHSKMPVLFNVARDPGERFPIKVSSDEYLKNVAKLKLVEAQHRRTIVQPGSPQLNWCDRAVENWSPPGCDMLGKCLDPPPSNLKKCFWPH